MKEWISENFGDIIIAVGELIGIVITVVLGYCYFRKKESDKLSQELYAKYQEISQELASILQDFLPLTLRAQGYSKELCDKVDADLSAFFFKYYLILPQSVLEEICCMHACLQTHGKNIYIVDRSSTVPLVRICSEENEVLKFFREVTMFRTNKNWAELFIRYKRVPNYIAMRCQARHVICEMQACWQYKDMHSWKKQMQKKTVARLNISDNHVKVTNKNH